MFVARTIEYQCWSIIGYGILSLENSTVSGNCTGTFFQGVVLLLTMKFHVICNVVKLCNDVKLMLLLRVLKQYKSDTFLAPLNNINIDRKENKNFMICRNFPNES